MARIEYTMPEPRRSERILKSGQQSKKWEWMPGRPYSAIRYCECCGRIGGTRTVKYYYPHVFGYLRTDDTLGLAKYCCFKCMAQIWPHMTKANEAAEIGLMCRKLLRQLPELFNSLNEGNRGRPEEQN